MANIKDIMTEEILRVSPIMSNDYNGQFPTGGKTSTTFALYTSSAYFYRANLTCDRYYTWTIEGFTNIGSHSFVLRNLTAQKVSRYFTINDYDLTIPGQTSTLVAIKKIDFTQYDGFIQAGDIAYDVQYYSGKQGEDYFNTLRFAFARTPYLVVGGNHEVYDRTWAFNYRFMMPDYNSLFQNNVYSSQRGNVFFLFVNFDYFYSVFRGTKMMFFEYVRQELERSRDPSIVWRVVVNHRPIYCADSLTYDCVFNFLGFKMFDDLYRKYNMNIILNGHIHIFQRVRLMNARMEDAKFTKTTQNGVSTYSNLKDPMATIKVVQGART